jgi:hypothetical protein
MSSEMQKAVQTSATELADKIDEMLLKFFGSVDDVRQYGHYYVLEQTPMVIETYTQPELTGNYFKVRTETKYRIRPKTQAELESENRD